MLSQLSSQLRSHSAGCTTTVVNGVGYQQCGPTYYQRVSTGYRVVVF